MEHFGKRIKNFRLRRDLTQERLAELLGVSAQAVSKWETGASCPDISALPQLSAALGVTLDELFATSEETHLARIEAMIEDSAVLSEEDFRYAERRLREYCGTLALRGRCLSMLAELYLGRAEQYNNLAGDCAKQALEIDPEKKDNHDALIRSHMRPELWDWCAGNYTTLIDYYRDFTAKHPDYQAGYFWYLDNLIRDRRLQEAREVVEKMRAVRDDFHYEMYLAMIAEREGEVAASERLLDEMVEKYPDEWMAWFVRGDAYAHRANYQKALADYREAAARQKKPRFSDVYDSIAQVCAVLGDSAGAIEAYEKVVEILRDDWDLTEGETVEGYLENIRQLKAKQ